MNKEERNRAIEQIQQDIETIKRDISWIIQHLLNQSKPIQPPPYIPNSPTIPKWPTVPTPFPRPMPTTPPTQPVWPGVRNCSKCGINLDGVMGYVCGDTNCPTFLKVTC
jgi:hypothetical protein